MSEEEIVSFLENEKGVVFNKMSKEDAVKYIKESTYYQKLSEYKKNYPSIEGKYYKLDFAYLVELCKMDRDLRYILFDLCMDIEHFLKNKLVQIVADIIIENFEANPVLEYFTLNEKAKSIIEAHATKETSYTHKYAPELDETYPIWIFVELASFGSIVSLCDYISTTYHKVVLSTKVLNNVRDIRNAVAHNNSILFDFVTLKQVTPLTSITTFVSEVGLGASTRKNNISNKFVHDFLSLCYAHKKIVSDSSKFNILKEFFETRAVLHHDYFETNSQVCRVYRFLKKIVDSL